MNPGNFPGGASTLSLTMRWGVRKLTAKSYIPSFFQGRQERSRSRDGVIEHSIIFQPVQPFFQTARTAIWPTAGRRRFPACLPPECPSGAGTAPGKPGAPAAGSLFPESAASNLRNACKRTGQPGNGKCPAPPATPAGHAPRPQFHVLNSYENTLHLHASLRT